MRNFYSELEKDKSSPFSFYIINGNSESNKNDVLLFLNKELNFSERKNSDFYNFKEFSLSIETAREIKKINSISKNNENSFRIFFIDTARIEEASQNALLKTFEEPQKNTIFFLFIKNNDLILDTLKSRARIILGNENVSSDRAIDFFESNYLGREKIIEKIIKKYSSEKIGKSQKIKENFLELFSEIEIIFLEKINSSNLKTEEILKFSKFYKIFLDLKVQARQNGSGIKNIFTYLAIFLPKI